MNRKIKYIVLLYSLVDLLVINGLFAIVLTIFDGLWHMPDLKAQWLTLNVAYMPVMGMTLVSNRAGTVLVMDRVAKSAFVAVAIHALTFLALTALLGLDALPTMAYLSLYAMIVVMVPTWWIISRYRLKLQRRKGKNQINVAIIGTGNTARRLADDITSDAGYGLKIIAFFDSYPRAGFAEDSLYMGTVDGLSEFVAANQLNAIYFALDEMDEAMFKSVVKIAEKSVIELYFTPSLPKYIHRNYDLVSIGSTTLMTTRPNPLNQTFNRIVKRGFDFVISSTFLLFFPLILMPIGILIKTSSPGPVFFRQKRTGYHGKDFTCLKFRTMRVNDDSDTRQATADDPRKTKIGDFLRRTNLDELPQFINVFMGDMSLVGPRPHMLMHTEVYSMLVSKYMVRHIVKPGITGWAQVNGLRGATDRLWKMEKRVEYDVWYVENWSLLLDVKILFRTVINSVRGEKNAY